VLVLESEETPSCMANAGPLVSFGSQSHPTRERPGYKNRYSVLTRPRCRSVTCSAQVDARIKRVLRQEFPDRVDWRAARLSPNCERAIDFLRSGWPQDRWSLNQGKAGYLGQAGLPFVPSPYVGGLDRCQKPVHRRVIPPAAHWNADWPTVDLPASGTKPELAGTPTASSTLQRCHDA
jgi:hypothetical protein